MKLRVPLLHEDPGSGSLDLTYEIWSEGGSGSPIVFLCGGPGERATELRPHLPWAQIAQNRPIVLLNQRGTDLVPGPLALRERMFVDPDEALAALAGQVITVNAAAYTPWQSALDLVLLADALGVERLDVIAHSYGTHLVMAAMKAIPERLNRVVMLGFEGPDQTFKFSAPFERALARVPEGAAGLERLESKEWSIDLEGVSLRVGPFGVRWMLASWMGLEARMRRLPDLLQDPATQLPRAIGGFVRMLQRRSPIFYLNDAASSASSSRWEKMRADSGPWAGVANFPFPEIGRAYGAQPLPDPFRQAPVFAGDVLVLTGEYDAFTPTGNFQEAGVGLARAEHREIQGAFHDTLLLSADIGRAIETWISSS
jgi:pimeloyl-ACP methyl ester carboxylesterase